MPQADCETTLNIVARDTAAVLSDESLSYFWSLNPRILHVVSSLGVGGAEVWLIALLRHNEERRRRHLPHHEIDILMTGGRRDALDDLAAELGATLHYIPFSRAHFGNFAGGFRKLLRARNYTAIHDQQDYSSAWHFLAGAGILPPERIVHVHNPLVALRNNTDTPARKFLFAIAKRIVKRSATHVLGTSAQALAEYGFNTRDFPHQVIRTVHCGFDVSRFEEPFASANDSLCEEFGWPHRSRVCLFAGRLEGFDRRIEGWNHKNPEFAMDVVIEAMSAGADFRFIMAGEGDTMRAKLISRARDAGFEDRIALPGHRLDVPRLMAGSHVCLFPSREEGLGMVVVEAQAAGLQVLASDAVPREAVVIPNLVKFLALDDGPSTWAKELTAALDLPRMDSSETGRLVRNSDFSIERSYENLDRIYRSALLTNGQGHS